VHRPFDVSPWIPNILYLITNLFVKGEAVLFSQSDEDVTADVDISRVILEAAFADQQ
jgi:hypothetical protein